jgi:tetratricopeptide (TPR) repeat protein
MARKKSKQAQKAKEWARQTRKSGGINWNLVGKVLATISAFIVGMVAAYQLVDYFRSDSKTFFSIIFPGFVIVIWLTILYQLIRKKNPYAIPLLTVTVLGAVVGGIGWNSYNQTQEDKVIVLVAQFDGPEETYGLRRQMMEGLREATKEYDDTIIIEGGELVTSSEYARELGDKAKADLVIWAWYRPTENPNITIHIENLSPTEFITLKESETYQPQATLAQLESFEIQRQLGSETSTLISFLTGLLKYKTGDYQVVIERFEQILVENDISTLINPFELYFALGDSYYAVGQVENAIQNYSKAVEINPQAAETYTNLGTAHNSLGNYEQAIQYFDKALEIDPQTAIAYNNRGHSYVNLEEFERAIQDFGKAIEIDPQAPTAYGSRGISYFSIGEYEQAFQDFDKAIEIFPHNPFNYFNRGYAYSSLEEYEKAIQDFNKVIQIYPQFPNAYSNRGEAYFELEQYELAIQDFDRAIEIDPFNSILYTNRGLAHANLRQYDLAFQDYERAIQINPQASMAYYNRGFDYYDTKQYQLALLDFNKYIELDPSDPLGYYQRGLTYQALGRTIEAEADFNKYEELTGQKP